MKLQVARTVMANRDVVVGISIGLSCLLGWWALRGKMPVNTQLETVKVRIGTKKVIPDPAKIETTGDWYFLDHISSGLVVYDHEKNVFAPNIAEKWDIAQDNKHIFKLRKDLKFSDGSPITPEDVEWSIKRLLIKKTSTHLPLWSYIQGCETLNTITDKCSGIKINEHGDLEIILKTKSESFFLQMASPETGIWSKSDIDPNDLSIKPTKYSGPYKIKTQLENGFVIERNENSLVSQKFLNSPKQIELLSLPIGEAENLLQDKKIDLVLRSHNPFGEKQINSHVKVHKTAPSTIIYFHSVHNNKSVQLIGQDFIKALWNKKADEAIPADTFLPFAAAYSIKREAFLEELPQRSQKTIRIGKPWTFYSEEFVKLLTTTANEVGINLEMVELSPKKWADAFEDKEAYKKIDFILAPYVASDRYPAVQLRFITGQMKQPEIDLKEAETPDLTPEKIEVLKKYQTWLLKSQSAVPLFFTRMQIFHNAEIDLGAQSKTDGEIELWRLTKKNL